MWDLLHDYEPSDNLPMMSSAHAVLPCHAGDSEEGEHFNLHFWIHEAMDGAVTASTTTKYFIWSRAARQLSTICKTVIKCKTTIKCCQWRRFEEGFSKIFLPLRTGAAFCDNKITICVPPQLSSTNAAPVQDKAPGASLPCHQVSAPGPGHQGGSQYLIQ